MQVDAGSFFCARSSSSGTVHVTPTVVMTDF